MTPAQIAQGFDPTLKAYQTKVETALAQLVPAPQTRPAVLHEAMQYSLLAGGKRLRPVLLLATFDCFPSNHDPLPAAVAIECLHTYTLIHDDLPCMDDSDLRRGKPTCHKQFDEATALLAGDGLLTHSLWMLAEHYHQSPALATALVRDLGSAAGSEKLIGGQMEDLLGELAEPDADRLQFIHENKTAALITAALTMGARISDASSESIEKLTTVGRCLGLAFQVIDDILDATADSTTLGKPTGADEANRKMTYPALFGLDESRKKANALTLRAKEICQSLDGETAFLLQLIEKMGQRIH